MAPRKLRTAIYTQVLTLDQDQAMPLRELHAYAAHRRLPFIEFIGPGHTPLRVLLQEWLVI
jgi:hypothetical protein